MVNHKTWQEGGRVMAGQGGPRRGPLEWWLAMGTERVSGWGGLKYKQVRCVERGRFFLIRMADGTVRWVSGKRLGRIRRKLKRGARLLGRDAYVAASCVQIVWGMAAWEDSADVPCGIKAEVMGDDDDDEAVQRKVERLELM